MKKLLVASTALMMISGYAQAHNAGCGLGTEIIGNSDSVMMQAFAATTNGSSGNQTFGITSGTSGCAKPANFVSNDLHEFVAGNMDSLAQDMAQGKGESMETLAELMKVSAQDKPAFFASMQRNFNQIFTNETVTSAQVIDNMVAVLG